jgi:ferritin-like metal-binding protein YciE
MANSKRDELVAWLKDAHAMERATVDNLENLLKTVDEYPDLRLRLQSHLDASRRQRDDLERELQRLGADTSALKDWAMKLGGKAQPFLSWFTSDSVPKNCLAAYAYENFEIASYRSLMGAAEELGMAELAALCTRAIAEEQQMADFLIQSIPAITRRYLETCQSAA